MEGMTAAQARAISKGWIDETLPVDVTLGQFREALRIITADSGLLDALEEKAREIGMVYIHAAHGEVCIGAEPWQPSLREALRAALGAGR